jgi:hypothetical protein
MVPERANPVVFGSTVKLIVEEPEPEGVEIILIHEAVDAADHKQPLFAVTPVEYVPPAATVACVEAVRVTEPDWKFAWTS